MARGALGMENGMAADAVWLGKNENRTMSVGFASEWSGGKPDSPAGGASIEAPRGLETSKTSIMVLDDYPIFCEGVRALVERMANYRFCGSAGTLESAWDMIRGENVRLAVLGLGLLGEHTSSFIQRLRRDCPQLLILVLVEKNGLSAGEAALKAGAHGLIMKDQGPRELIEAIGAVLRGEMYMTNSLSSLMLKKAYFGEQKDGVSARLSNREMEIFGLLGMGYGTREIAMKLNLSRRTVNVHRENIKRKLGLKAASGLVYAAIRWVGNRTPSPAGRGSQTPVAAF